MDNNKQTAMETLIIENIRTMANEIIELCDHVRDGHHSDLDTLAIWYDTKVIRQLVKKYNKGKEKA